MSLARELANAIDRAPDGADLGPTDTEMCAKALRYFAGRWARRAVLAAVAAIGVGLPDINHDGRVSLADLGAAVQMIAPGA